MDDAALFAPERLASLRAATQEMSWLLSRGYGERATLKLVGDRHALGARAREAIQRAACTDAEKAARAARRVEVDALAGRSLAIDGLNVLIIAESAASGRVVLRGRDGFHRDLASVHGAWRRRDPTERALSALLAVLEDAGPATVRWLLDRPVSNSGQLRALIERRARERELRWEAELVDDADSAVAETEDVVASADAWVLDRCRAAVDLPGAAIARGALDAWVVDLRDDSDRAEC